MTDSEPKPIDPEEVLLEAEQILASQRNPDRRPLLEKLSSFKDKVLEAKNIREALMLGLVIGYSVVWPVKTIFSAPFNYVGALKENGYSKTAKVMGSAAVILPAISAGDSFLRGEPLEIVALRGISTLGIEGFAAMAFHASLIDSKKDAE